VLLSFALALLLACNTDFVWVLGEDCMYRAPDAQFATDIRAYVHSGNGTDVEECPMREWRLVIQQWVAQESSTAPLTEQRLDYWIWTWARALYPPAHNGWPSHLPTCQALHDFYRLCDGGSLAWFNWLPLAQLAERNRYWLQYLHDWDARGDVLDSARHVVIAEDAGGCPVVWDARSDEVRAFQVDGGDWESPLASSIEAFLTQLVNPVEGAKDMDAGWHRFLNWLDGQLLRNPPR
jgi:hypothetical protein